MLKTRNCEILDPPKTPPGTPLRPKGGLVHSRDIYQYYRLEEILKTNFEEQFDVPLVALQPVNPNWHDLKSYTKA